MACCPTEVKYGYEDSRFERDVDEHFHCSICYNVLKEPRSCRNNDHLFCLDCITEHLNVNSQTCPECNENLSVDTLRRPRVLNNYLSKLKINCDYASRGCPEFVCVEDLKTHVSNCGFAPVLCSNENCGAEIYKKDKFHHETAECEYRTTKCRDCGQIREDVGALKESLEREVEALSGKMQNGHVELERKIEVANEQLKKKFLETNEKVEASRVETNNSLEQIRRDHEEVKKEVKVMKENLYKVNKDVDEVKVMMSQMLEKFEVLEMSMKLPSPTEGILSKPREDILIAGGHQLHTNINYTEIYSWEKNGWFMAPPVNEKRNGASSFIYDDKMFIVGGDECRTIETLDLNKLPLKWNKFSGKLPYTGNDYQTVVYQQRVFHIGGYDCSKEKQSSAISELKLSSCSLRELCQMPGPRDCHRVEVVENKILIFGGENDIFDLFDSVLEFDPKTKMCRKMPPLPHPLKYMATVTWKDQVVVIGGRDEDSNILNDVFMYDCKTGMITVLPSMLEKRCECCAIITGNTIVVMGGVTKSNEKLNSVECFTMGDSTWKYLPAMNQARARAVAVVLPPQRKYV